jgi:hypothetical protein
MSFGFFDPDLFANAISFEQIDEGTTPNDSQEKADCA